MQRTILHVDLNNCYASIECLHNPSLKGKPVSVGGDVEARHGIILASSYEAKAYGIKVGQALWQAREKCPDLIIVPPNYSLYLRFSGLVRKIMADYTDLIEPFGLDEAWMDITGTHHLGGDGRAVADEIRQRVQDELGLTVSVGVSFNKIFAKLGSDYKKPNATTVITQENFKDFIWGLPASELLLVGRATKQKLFKRNIQTIGELANTDPELLHSWFGKWGYILHDFANGRDATPVAHKQAEPLVKSVGNSTTTPRDLENKEDVKMVFYHLSESVAARLREQGLKGRTVQVSLRDNKLFRFERQLTLDAPTNLAKEICAAAMQLTEEHYDWRSPLRSIGVRAMNLSTEAQGSQITLFADEEGRIKQEKLERAIDAIRRRFGHYAIGRAINGTDEKLGKMNPKGDHVIHPVGYFGQ